MKTSEALLILLQNTVIITCAEDFFNWVDNEFSEDFAENKIVSKFIQDQHEIIDFDVLESKLNHFLADLSHTEMRLAMKLLGQKISNI